MKGIDIATVRYAIFKQSALANVSTDNYPAVIEEFGHDLKEEYLPYINGNGFAILFTGESGVTPETTYVFMATATNTVGDKVTKWGSATTSAAPDAARAKAQAATRTDEPAPVAPPGNPSPTPRSSSTRWRASSCRRSETRRRPLDHHSQHAQHQIRVHL